MPETLRVHWIEGDGIGPELWRVARPVMDAAVRLSYGTERSLEWVELLAGDKAVAETGSPLPEATLATLLQARDSAAKGGVQALAMKGPLGTPVGTGIRSLTVALRQALDLYACIRPIRHFAGLETPLKHPERVNMTVFRENTEDLYAGIEYAADTPEARKLIAFMHDELGVVMDAHAAVGLKPMTRAASSRLVLRAVRYALDAGLPSVTLMHKGNIMKFTEGGFRQWGYEAATAAFPDSLCTEADPIPGRLILKDRIADALFQEVLLHPEQFSVIATPNLNGDYISDALAAQVGGLGMAPGVNMSDALAFYEATHGTAPSIAGKDRANPCSLILCGALMFQNLGWHEAARRIEAAVEKAVAGGTVTADLAAEIPGAKILGCTAFGELIGGSL